MKRLVIACTAYKYIEKSFGEWLDILGYAPQTVYQMPVAVRELLHYLEQQGKSRLEDITVAAIQSYYETHLKQRTNYLYGAGALSHAHLNKHLQALRKFADYLRQTGRLPMRQELLQDPKPTVLTEAEIALLYATTHTIPAKQKHSKAAWLYEALGSRDRALLSVFYGCGLRRNEGYHLHTGDVY